jgi:hypothetical protein
VPGTPCAPICACSPVVNASFWRDVLYCSCEHRSAVLCAARRRRRASLDARAGRAGRRARTLFGLAGRGAVTKVLATIALGAASLGLVTQPAPAWGTAAERTDPAVGAIGGALEAHGIAACEAPWDLKQEGGDDTPSRRRGERTYRARLVVVNRACPAPDESGVVPGGTDGVVEIVVYKSAEFRRRGAKRFRGDSTIVAGYSYGARTLTVLEKPSSPDIANGTITVLEKPTWPDLANSFHSAMGSLRAKRLWG